MLKVIIFLIIKIQYTWFRTSLRIYRKILIVWNHTPSNWVKIMSSIIVHRFLWAILSLKDHIKIFWNKKTGLDSLHCLFMKNLLLSFINKAILTWIKLKFFLIKSIILKIPTLKLVVMDMARSIMLFLIESLLLISLKIYQNTLTKTRIKVALISSLSLMVGVKLITLLIQFTEENHQVILKLVSLWVDLKIFTGMTHWTLVVNTERMSLKVWWLVGIRIFQVTVRISLVTQDTTGTLRWKIIKARWGKAWEDTLFDLMIKKEDIQIFRKKDISEFLSRWWVIGRVHKNDFSLNSLIDL